MLVVQSRTDVEVGRLTRMDLGCQYQWQLSASQLERDTISILHLAYTEEGCTPDHVQVATHPHGDAECLILRGQHTGAPR